MSSDYVCDNEHYYFPELLRAVWVIFAAAAVANAATVVIPAGANIQDAVDANPPGTYFQLAAGIYRMQSVIPKDGDQFFGAIDAAGNRLTILTGAQPLGPYSRDAQGNYIATTTQTEHGQMAGYCAPGFERCNLPEDLFYDDQPYVHNSVGPQALTPGQYYFDYPNGAIYIRPRDPGDDPAIHKVEYNRTALAFSGTAADVVIKNLIVENYAAPNQFGAIGGDNPGTGWIIENNETRFNHGSGLHVSGGAQVLNNYTHDNGQDGMGGSGIGILVQGNEIARNNYSGIDHDFECGGVKFAYSDGLVVRNNYSHDNNGPGMWTDISSIRALYEFNVVVGNARAGIFHETSYDAVIRDNLIVNNGSLAPDDWFWNAQIQIAASQNVEVFGNIVLVDSQNNGNGIMLLQQNRTAEPCLYGPCRVINNYIHDNYVIVTGQRSHGTSGGVEDYIGQGDLFDPSSNNRFDRNHYYVNDVTSSAYWQWRFVPQTFNGFRSFSMETLGTLNFEQ